MLNNKIRNISFIDNDLLYNNIHYLEHEKIIRIFITQNNINN